jgi:hypothetical protein
VSWPEWLFLTILAAAIGAICVFLGLPLGWSIVASSVAFLFLLVCIRLADPGSLS